MNKKTFKLLLSFVIILALVGLGDSFYLFMTEKSGSEVICGTGGCSFVLSSPYSYVLGVKLPIWGMLYYFSLLLFSFFTLLTLKKIFLQILTLISLSGFLMSLYFTYVQFYELVSLCQWCLLSALTSTLIFITTLILYSKNRKQQPNYSL